VVVVDVVLVMVVAEVEVEGLGIGERRATRDERVEEIGGTGRRPNSAWILNS
jgi:hypothetical protein